MTKIHRVLEQCDSHLKKLRDQNIPLRHLNVVDII